MYSRSLSWEYDEQNLHTDTSGLALTSLSVVDG